MPVGPAGTNAAAEPETLAFESTVRAVDGTSVWLEETYFYPESGGQPADEGTLGGIDVVDVRLDADGRIEHVLAEPSPAAVGETVTGSIDEATRTYNRRAHTASHVVYGASRRLLDATGYAGFDINAERIRIDVETDLTVAEADVLGLQRAANEVVWEDRAVEWYGMDVAAARADEAIVFNLGEGAGATEGVRIVEIEGWDVSACGGTHVRSTAEIGPIKLCSVSNPGADCLRVEYAVGPPAIERQLAETRAATNAADELGTSVESLAERVDRLAAERDALATTVADLRERLVATRIEAMTGRTFERDGREWLVGAVDDADATTVADVLRSFERSADVRVLVGRDGSTFVVVAVDEDAVATDAAEGVDVIDAPAVVDALTGRFGGGGGGQPTLAQGGGLDAEPEAVVEALRDGRVEL